MRYLKPIFPDVCGIEVLCCLVAAPLGGITEEEEWGTAAGAAVGEI